MTNQTNLCGAGQLMLQVKKEEDEGYESDASVATQPPPLNEDYYRFCLDKVLEYMKIIEDGEITQKRFMVVRDLALVATGCHDCSELYQMYTDVSRLTEVMVET
jgi:hypothetical protein